MEEARSDAGLTSDVELIRDLSAAVGRRDVRAVGERLHPEIVWEHNVGVGSPEEGVYRGRDSVMALLERILEPWEYLRAELREINDLGDGSYLIKGDLHAKHSTSGTELVSPYQQRFEVSDGLLEKARMTTGVEFQAEESRNVATVRKWIDAFNRLDIDSVTHELDPEAELHEWPTAPGAQVYRGPEGVRAAIDSWFEIWEWMEVTVEDLREIGDQVLITLHQRAQGRGSSAEVEIRTFNVYTFRDGRVYRMQLFTEPEPALEAVGLTESGKEAE
jgi:ketosteroid isomerase-like protein